MSEQRQAMIHRVVTLKWSVTRAAREFGVSRKTVHKWLKRYRAREPAPLHDRSRRPARSPSKTADAVESAVLDVRARHGWGPRKIHRTLRDQRVPAVPSVRTVASILARRGCVGGPPAVPPPPPPRPFERAAPNERWQMDHKGAIEVARQRVCPLVVIDDHSRYCLCFTRVPDLTVRGRPGTCSGGCSSGSACPTRCCATTPSRRPWG